MSDEPRGGAPETRRAAPPSPERPTPRRPPVDPDGALVRDFFARERAAAPTLDADPVRWQEIVEASARSRRPWLRYAAGAAAAAVVLGAVGVAVLGRGSTTPPAPAGPVLSSSVVGSSAPSPRPTSPSQLQRADADPSTSHCPPCRPPLSPPSPPSPPSAALVPASFVVRSLTTGAAGHLFALGTVACAGGECPALAGSSDNGASWTLRHTFPASTAAPRSAPGRLGGAGSLTQVRFASASVGWAFGGAAMRTTDGGVTWQDYPHPGGEVIGLETDGTDVVLTTAPGCSDGMCHGAISVVRAPVTAASATDVAGTIDGGSGVKDAQISWQRGRAFVSPVVVPTAGRPGPTPVVVAPDGLHRAAPTSCGTGQAVQLVTAAAGTTLFAVCPSGGAAGQIGYAVQSSSDGGASWRQFRRAAPAHQRRHDLLRGRRRADSPRRLRRQPRRPRLDEPQQGRRRHLARAEVGPATAQPRVGVGRSPRRRDVLRAIRRRVGRLLEERRPRRDLVTGGRGRPLSPPGTGHSTGGVGGVLSLELGSVST